MVDFNLDPKLPAIWLLSDIVDSQFFTDACMYLLFLGGMKVLATMIIPPMFSKCGKLAHFACNYMNPNLKALHSIKGIALPIDTTCSLEC